MPAALLSFARFLMCVPHLPACSPVGTFNAGKNRNPCTSCATGFTTEAAGSKELADCVIQKGAAARQQQQQLRCRWPAVTCLHACMGLAALCRQRGGPACLPDKNLNHTPATHLLPLPSLSQFILALQDGGWTLPATCPPLATRVPTLFLNFASAGDHAPACCAV